MGRIVHDDRGNAVVQWEDAPADYERPVLEIGAEQLSLDPSSCDPYASSGPLERKRTQGPGGTSRTDLRKLSEWIKMMRELEQRKLRGDSDDE